MKPPQKLRISGNRDLYETGPPQNIEAIIADAFLWKVALLLLGSDHAQSTQYTN